MLVLTIIAGASWSCGKGVGLTDQTDLPDPLVDINASFSKPTPIGTIFGDHDTAVRTLSFSHDGTTVQCSHDNGSSWSGCDSDTSLIYTTSDYASGNNLKVKISRDGARDYIYTYNPSTSHPGLTFYTCDTTISTSMNFTNFDLQVTAGASNTNICFGSGVTIQNAGNPETRISITGDNIRLIGLSSDKPYFYNNRTDTGSSCSIGGWDNVGTVFFASGKTLTFANLKVQTDGCRGVGFNLATTGALSGTYTLSNITATATGENADVAGSSGASNTSNITIDSSTLSVTGIQSGGSFPTALAMTLVGNFTITNSTIQSTNAHAVEALSATFVASNTTFSSTATGATSGPTLSLSASGGNTASYTVNNSTIWSASRAVMLVNADGISPPTAEFNGTTFKHLAIAGTPSGAIALVTNNSTVNSTSNGNFFCDVDGTTNRYTSVLDVGANSNLGNWNSASQVNGGNLDANINDCP